MIAIILGALIPLVVSIFLSLYLYKKEGNKILPHIGLFISYIIIHLTLYRGISFSPSQSTDYIPFALFISLISSIILSYKDFNNFSKLIIKIVNYSLVIGIASISFIKHTWIDNEKIIIPAIVIFLTLLFDYFSNKKQENNDNSDNFLYIFIISLLGSGIAVISSIASIGQMIGATAGFIFPLMILFFKKDKDINTESFNLIFNSFYSIVMFNIYLLSPNEPSIYSMIIIVFSPLVFLLSNMAFPKSKNYIKISVKSFLTLCIFAISTAIILNHPTHHNENKSLEHETEYNYGY